MFVLKIQFFYAYVTLTLSSMLFANSRVIVSIVILSGGYRVIGENLLSWIKED